MTFAARYATRAYETVGIETGVEGADPHRLILMLFDGADVALTDAKRHLAIGTVTKKCESISKAIRIIEEGLRASLDVDAGGPLAEKLSALYDYMARRLVMANLKNSPEMIDEVRKLLGELRDAWAAIRTGTSANAAPATAQRRA
jgi:flagellar protein FliS